MKYYHQKFPDNLSAIQMYTAEPGSDLPEGVYAFLELYCCNQECDCEKVIIEVAKQSAFGLGYFEIPDEATAVLEYTWKQPLSEHNPCFSDQVVPSEHAAAARRALVDYIQIDPGYNKELSMRYTRMKENKAPEPFGPISTTYLRKSSKTGRNDPCLCGSGRKYKKCCINKKSPHDQ